MSVVQSFFVFNLVASILMRNSQYLRETLLRALRLVDILKNVSGIVILRRRFGSEQTFEKFSRFASSTTARSAVG